MVIGSSVLAGALSSAAAGAAQRAAANSAALETLVNLIRVRILAPARLFQVLRLRNTATTPIKSPQNDSRISLKEASEFA
jgi:uncharacterized membrane protein YadS